MYFAITKRDLHQSVSHLIYENNIFKGDINNELEYYLSHRNCDNINKTSFGLVIQESLKIIRLIRAL